MNLIAMHYHRAYAARFFDIFQIGGRAEPVPEQSNETEKTQKPAQLLFNAKNTLLWLVGLQKSASSVQSGKELPGDHQSDNEAIEVSRTTADCITANLNKTAELARANTRPDNEQLLANKFNTKSSPTDASAQADSSLSDEHSLELQASELLNAADTLAKTTPQLTKSLPQRVGVLSDRERTLREAIRHDRAELARLLPGRVPGEAYEKPCKQRAACSPTKFTAVALRPSACDKTCQEAFYRKDYYSPHIILNHMTATQQDAYFVAKYTNTKDYPRKSDRSIARLREVVRSVLNEALDGFSDATYDHLKTDSIYLFTNPDQSRGTSAKVRIERASNQKSCIKKLSLRCAADMIYVGRIQTRHAELIDRMLQLEFADDRVVRVSACGHNHRGCFEFKSDVVQDHSEHNNLQCYNIDLRVSWVLEALHKWSKFAEEIHELRRSRTAVS